MNDTVLTKTYFEFAESHDCFLDGILCDPRLRDPFLQELYVEHDEQLETETLERLVYLRKRGMLARKKPR
jgi:hypothetical protein